MDWRQGNRHNGPAGAPGAMEVMRLEEEELKMMMRNQAPGVKRRRRMSQVPSSLSSPRPCLLGWQSRGALPLMASRGRSWYRFEALTGALESRGLIRIILGKHRHLQSQWKHSGFRFGSSRWRTSWPGVQQGPSAGHYILGACAVSERNCVFAGVLRTRGSQSFLLPPSVNKRPFSWLWTQPGVAVWPIPSAPWGWG